MKPPHTSLPLPRLCVSVGNQTVRTLMRGCLFLFRVISAFGDLASSSTKRSADCCHDPTQPIRPAPGRSRSRPRGRLACGVALLTLECDLALPNVVICGPAAGPRLATRSALLHTTRFLASRCSLALLSSASPPVLFPRKSPRHVVSVCSFDRLALDSHHSRGGSDGGIARNERGRGRRRAPDGLLPHFAGDDGPGPQCG